MSKKQFSFFATESDLSGVLEAVASKTPFLYSTMDDLNSTPSVYDSISDIPDLSIAINGDINRGKIYLLLDTNASPVTRHVEQRHGGTKHIFDQLAHPESVVLKPGGVFGDFECIVGGQIGTISKDKWSVDLYKALLVEFKKRFKKVRAFYVGNLAMKKFESGVRLRLNVKSPPEYDLEL